MVKNKILDHQRERAKFIEEIDLLYLAEKIPEINIDEESKEALWSFIHKHKYGYIVIEMEKGM